MVNDSNRTNLTIIIVLVFILVGVSILVISSHFFTKEKVSNNDNDTELLEGDTNVIEPDTKNKTYYIGDSVILVDSSSWHIIKDSNEEDSYVTLLKDNPLEDKILYKQMDDYLNNSYKEQLQNLLSTSEEDLIDIQALSFDQIRVITNMNDLSVETKFEDEQFSWLYQSTTLLKEANQNPVLICSKDDSDVAKICEGTMDNLWPIRPVITIKKEYIQ